MPETFSPRVVCVDGRFFRVGALVAAALARRVHDSNPDPFSDDARRAYLDAQIAQELRARRGQDEEEPRPRECKVRSMICGQCGRSHAVETRIALIAPMFEAGWSVQEIRAEWSCFYGHRAGAELLNSDLRRLGRKPPRSAA